MNLRQTQCTGCGGDLLSEPFTIPNQPVVLNYRFASAEAARSVPRRDIVLVQCKHCGLVFNFAFDAEAVPYDENYENRQCFSPTFQEHLASLATELTTRLGLRGGRILEVGCGKGDFLRLLCGQAQATGIGYDTSYEGPETAPSAAVQFHRRYVTSADVRERFELVVCRHVVEHVPGIGNFLETLQEIAVAAGNAVVVIETPRLEWIIENGSFWDVFYEHCNYFTMTALARLAREAGFAVLRQSAVFGEQYQLIELKPSLRSDAERGAEGRAGILPARSTSMWSAENLPTSKDRQDARTSLDENAPSDDLIRLGHVLNEGRSVLEEKLRRAGIERGWAIWGAGAKGVALVNRLRVPSPRCVIDSNPAKSGCVIPGSDVPVISANDPRVLEIPVILVANPNYLREIETGLVSRGFRHTLITT